MKAYFEEKIHKTYLYYRILNLVGIPLKNHHIQRGLKQEFSMKQHYIRSQQQISFVKEMFSRQLAQQLGLMEVQAPF